MKKVIFCGLVFCLVLRLGSASWLDDFMDEQKVLLKGFKDMLQSTNKDVMKEVETGFKKEREELETNTDSSEEDGDPDSTEGDDGDTNISSTSIFDVFTGWGVWWKGPNVCVTKEETDIPKAPNAPKEFGMIQNRICYQKPNSYTCETKLSVNGDKKMIVQTYKCCPGFVRNRSSGSGCQKVEIRSSEEVLKELGANDFIRMVTNGGRQLFTNGNKTIFVPLVNKISNEFSNEVNEFDELKGVDIMNYVVDGVHSADDMENEMVLYTENNSSLRINKYPSVTTVNCVPINKTDLFIEYGIMHAINGTLNGGEPKTALDVLSQPRFSKFKKLLEENDLLDFISNENPKTILAVTNDGVDLMDSKYALCLKTILQHHLIEGTVCSNAITEHGILTLDVRQGPLKLTRDSKTPEKIIFDGDIQSIEEDIVVKDGVVHVLPNLLIPLAGRSIAELLKDTNHTKFFSLLEQTGLTKDIYKSNAVTIFVPSEDRLTVLESLEGDDLKKQLGLHIAEGKHRSDLMTNGEILSSRTEGNNLRVTLRENMMSLFSGFNPVPLVQCEPLRKVDGMFCNGVAHSLSEPLRSSAYKIRQILDTEPELSTFKKVLEGTKLKYDLDNNKLGNSITILAPSNKGFERIGSDNLDTLLRDKRLADEILRSSILGEAICCSNVSPSSWPFISTSYSVSGEAIPLNRLVRSNTTVFGRVNVSQCDLLFDSGVLHIMDGLLVSPRRVSGEEIILKKLNSEIILGGF